MPVYDYKCKDHGVFHELAAMDKAADPAACPSCKALSPRIIMIPPEVLAMAPDKKKAIMKNEQAQASPIISTIDTRAEQAERTKHASSCGCSSHKSKNLEQTSLKQQVVYMADGSKVFPSQRPWMISH